MAIVVFLAGMAIHRRVYEDVSHPSDPDPRQDAYKAVRQIVNARWTDLGVEEPLSWKDLKKRSYGLGDEVGNLEAAWSFKDSWVSN